MAKNHYTEEFKMNIIELYNNKSKTVNELSIEYDISEVAIRRWINNHKNVDKKTKLSAIETEVKKLKDELILADEKIETLKNVIRLFTLK